MEPEQDLASARDTSSRKVTGYTIYNEQRRIVRNRRTKNMTSSVPWDYGGKMRIRQHNRWEHGLVKELFKHLHKLKYPTLKMDLPSMYPAGSRTLSCLYRLDRAEQRMFPTQDRIEHGTPEDQFSSRRKKKEVVPPSRLPGRRIWHTVSLGGHTKSAGFESRNQHPMTGYWLVRRVLQRTFSDTSNCSDQNQQQRRLYHRSLAICGAGAPAARRQMAAFLPGHGYETLGETCEDEIDGGFSVFLRLLGHCAYRSNTNSLTKVLQTINSVALPHGFMSSEHPCKRINKL